MTNQHYALYGCIDGNLAGFLITGTDGRPEACSLSAAEIPPDVAEHLSNLSKRTLDGSLHHSVGDIGGRREAPVPSRR